MEVSDIQQLHGFHPFQFEEQEVSWKTLLTMIRSRSKDNRAWSLVKRIREVRLLYWNVIQKSKAMNQVMIQASAVSNKKGKPSSIAVAAVNSNELEINQSLSAKRSPLGQK